MQYIFKKIAIFLATGLGVGLIFPVGQGTAAAFLTIFLIPSFLKLSGFYQLAAVILGGLAAVRLASVAADHFNTHDDHRIVVDEIISVFITFLGLGGHLSSALLAAGFVLNRVLDWIKPLPMRKLESLPLGWGIVLDDVAGGIFSNLILRLLLALL